VGAQQTAGVDPIFPRQTLVQRRWLIAQRFVARREVGMESKPILCAFALTQFCNQKLAKETMQF
jgi:hypothetical protein